MSAESSTRLLVAVVNDADKVDEILSGFLELGITGATILNSEGMGGFLSHEVPIFAGLQTLISGSRPQNRMILSVVPIEVPPLKDYREDIPALLDHFMQQMANSSGRTP